MSETPTQEPLPIGWARTDIGTLGNYINGRGFGKSEWKKSGLPIIRIQNLNDTSAVFNYSDQIHEDRYKVEDGDLLVAWAASLGVFRWNRGPAWLNQHIFRVEPDERVVRKNFLYYALEGAIEGLYRKAHGSGMVHVTRGKFDSYPINLPPLNEQDRIVSKIDELFSEIKEGERALEKVRTLVERYRQSLLKAAVTGELTRDWREKHKDKLESGEALLARILKARREAWETAEVAKMKAKGLQPQNGSWKKKYKEPALPLTTGLPSLPYKWTWCSLPMLGEFGRGKSKHRPRNDKRLYGGDYPFFQTGIVRASRGRITQFDSTYNELGLAQSKLWPRGTICITIAANIAESGIMDFEGCFPDSIVGLVPSKMVVPEYIEFFVRTARSSLSYYAPATAQKNINLDILEQVAVPLPPLEEQGQIYSVAQEELSKIDHIESELNANARRLEALRQSTLKSAFSGKLIPQDPADEPASVLLERIAADRAAASSNRKKPAAKPLGRTRKATA